MNRNFKVIVFIVIGVISVGLSIRCFSFDEMDYVAKSVYGGDAFTGIQNAGAQASENIRDLAKIIQFGFGSVLLVAGMGFLGIGLTTPVKEEIQEEVSETKTTDSSEMLEDNEIVTNDNQ